MENRYSVVRESGMGVDHVHATSAVIADGVLAFLDVNDKIIKAYPKGFWRELTKINA